MKRIDPEIRAAVEQKAKGFGLLPDLMEAIILVESSGNKDAWRYEPAFYVRYVEKGNYPDELKKELATSWGLMQVMGLVAWERGLRWKIKETLCTVDGGLDYGMRHFARYLNKYGSVDDAIAAYNAGSPRRGADQKYVNQRYVDKVRKYFADISDDQ